ncbi:MAG: methyltransferase domain-containing protein [Planctomycetes bacterium]|nr:methyltransferase domain-containing protein [Planctomycetota bacterium]MBI3835139.1 methyltransferase domain-containing protein [Planctomycetota bacterium]
MPQIGRRPRRGGVWLTYDYNGFDMAAHTNGHAKRHRHSLKQGDGRNGESGNGVAVAAKLKTAIGHRWEFLTNYLRHPTRVGAIAPSSQALAEAITEPYRNHGKPSKVLEIGAGTGPVTRYLGTVFGPKDRLDVCEISSELSDILERDVLTAPSFARGIAEGRVRLLRVPAQQIPADQSYDFIICGLPLTAFPLQDVKDVFAFIRKALAPDGVMSYFEYIGFRRTSRALALGRRRDRIREVHAYLSRNIREHQFDRRSIYQNLPPAHVRHLRFD